MLQPGPLAATLVRQIVSDPLSVPAILAWVGPAAMFDWLLHFMGLVLFSFLHWDAAKYQRWTQDFKSLSPRHRFRVRRTLESWEYGCGADYKP